MKRLIEIQEKIDLLQKEAIMTGQIYQWSEPFEPSYIGMWKKGSHTFHFELETWKDVVKLYNKIPSKVNFSCTFAGNDPLPTVFPAVINCKVYDQINANRPEYSVYVQLASGDQVWIKVASLEGLDLGASSFPSGRFTGKGRERREEMFFVPNVNGLHHVRYYGGQITNAALNGAELVLMKSIFKPNSK